MVPPLFFFVLFCASSSSSPSRGRSEIVPSSLDSMPLRITELEPVVLSDDDVAAMLKEGGGSDESDGVQNTIRSFSLSLNGITAEVCSLGASISKLLVPSYASKSSSTTEVDDIVLGYKSPSSMFASKNPPYFGVTVGRVANRIAKGRFALLDSNDKQHVYNLAKNNGPNHLHGGLQGFSHKLWDAEIVEDGGSSKGVRFTLLSKDGDQGYPGSVLATVTYTLVPITDDDNKKAGESPGATLRIVMTGRLVCDDDGNNTVVSTPINLAQHSYFNLARHNAPNGILDHIVGLNCDSYTPLDETSIPTREVRLVADDPAMDLRPPGKRMKDALVTLAAVKAGLSIDEATRHVSNDRQPSEIARAGPNGLMTPGEPYGYDHNYVVNNNNIAPQQQQDDVPDEQQEQEQQSTPTTTPSRQQPLNLVGTVVHTDTKRKMTVKTSAPGVQFYTANYLDGTLSPDDCKESSVYGQWQGLCLETQNFPDSVLLPGDEETHPGFAGGKCTILRSGEQDSYYEHTVEYSFESIM